MRFPIVSILSSLFCLYLADAGIPSMPLEIELNRVTTCRALSSSAFAVHNFLICMRNSQFHSRFAQSVVHLSSMWMSNIVRIELTSTGRFRIQFIHISYQRHRQKRPVRKRDRESDSEKEREGASCVVNSISIFVHFGDLQLKFANRFETFNCENVLSRGRSSDWNGEGKKKVRI